MIAIDPGDNDVIQWHWQFSVCWWSSTNDRNMTHSSFTIQNTVHVYSPAQICVSLPLCSSLHDSIGGDGVHHLVRLRGQVQSPERRLPPLAATPRRLWRRDPAHLHGLQEVPARSRVSGRERKWRGDALRQQNLRTIAPIWLLAQYFILIFPL